MKNSLSQVSQRAGRIRGYAGGGVVRGPGTGTSDSISAKLSDGEFVLPADTVRKVGVKSLRDLVHATHTPVKAKPGRHNYANGDLATDDEQKHPNSFGDAAAAAADPSVTQVKTAAPAAPAPPPAAASAAASPNQTSPANTFPQSSPSAGANVYGGAGPGALGSSGQLASVPDGIGGQPGRQPARPNSFGDAAPAPVATPAAEPAATVANIPQPALQSVPAGAKSFGDAAAAARDSSVAQVPTGTQDARTRLLGPSAIPTGGLKAPAPDGSHDRWSNTEVGRNVTNSLAALPGVAGALPTIAKTGGAVSSGINAASRLLNVGAGVAAAGGAPTPAPAASSPSFAASEAGAGRGVVNPARVDPSTPLPQSGPSSDPQPGYGPIGDRMKLTNEQAATMNPAGRITATRGANGTMEFSGGNVSGQVSYNDAGGNALPGGGLNGKGFSGFDVAPAGANIATGPNGSYAFATSGSGLRDQGGQGSQGGQQDQGGQGGQGGQGSGYTADGVDVRGLNGPQAERYAAEVRQAQAINKGQAEQRKSWEHRVAQWDDPFSGIGKARRNMEVSMSGMTGYHHRGKGGAGEALAASRMAAYGNLAAQHFGMAAGDRDDATRRHTSDNTLRGTEMQEQGGTARARLMEAGHNNRFGQTQGLARDKFGLEQTAAGYQNRGAQRIEKAQQDLEAAGSDPAKQRSARQRLLGLMGKQDDDAWQGIALQGATDVHGNKTEGVLAALNKRTGDVRRLDQGAQHPSAAPAEGTRVRGKDGKMYVVKDGKPVLVGG